MAVVMKNSYVGVAPRKVRQVCDLIRKKKVSDALKILRFCEKKEIAIVVTKLLNSALAKASEAGKYDIDNLAVGKICVDEGPMQKRIQARAQGRAYQIRKRSSHIIVELREE